MDKERVCRPDFTFRDVVQAITRGRLGLVLVTEDGKLVGLITDGDVRWAFDREDDFLTLQARNIMARQPRVVAPKVRFA